jgi:hypothetical protein
VQFSHTARRALAHFLKNKNKKTKKEKKKKKKNFLKAFIFIAPMRTDPTWIHPLTLPAPHPLL